MKKILSFILVLITPFIASGQFTFEWEEQLINEDNNMKGMSIVNDTTTLLAGYGRTFVNSRDLGQTWEKIPLLDPMFDWADISINSSGLGFAVCGDDKVVDNPGGGEPDVYADGVLLKTTDHGATWTVFNITEIGLPEDDPEKFPAAEGCFARNFRSVEVLEDNTVYLGMGWKYHNPVTGETTNIKGNLKTADQVTWTPIENGVVHTQFIESGSDDIYYGGPYHLFREEVGSDNVTDVYPALTAAAGDPTVLINDVTLAPDGAAYVVTFNNGIFVTHDRGATFKLLENGAHTGSNDMLLVNDSVWIVLGLSGSSLATRDSGATWVSCYPGVACDEIGGILNDSIIGLGESYIHKLAVADAIAGNYTWKSQLIKAGQDMQKMHITDANNAIIVGYGNTLVATNDGGISWNDIATPELFIYGASYDFEAVSAASDTVSWVISKRMYVADYKDNSTVSDLFAHGLVYKTTDLWNSWELINHLNIGTGTDPAYNPNADGAYGLDPLTVTAIDDKVVYMGARWLDTIAGYANKDEHSNVFKSIDGGDSWTTILNDYEGKVINQVLFLDENNGFVIGNNIFQVTADGGQTFTDLYPVLVSTGSPADDNIFLKSIEYVNADKWYLLSSVDGVFVTEDGGQNFSKLPSIGGGGGMAVLNDSTIIVLGSSTKSKISWDRGSTWHNCYPGSTIWEIGGILDDQLVALAKSSLYKIPLADLEAPSSEAEILSFSLDAQTGEAVIDSGNGTVSIEVAAGTDVTALSPVITVSEEATISPASGAAQDFTNPVTYTVTAEDMATTRDWTVTVTIAVGIEEAETAITMYPNPVTDRLFLGNLESIDRIRVSTITGSTLLEMETPADAATLDMRNYKDGIYFISFTGKDGAVTARKFMINK